MRLGATISRPGTAAVAPLEIPDGCILQSRASESLGGEPCCPNASAPRSSSSVPCSWRDLDAAATRRIVEATSTGRMAPDLTFDHEHGAGAAERGTRLSSSFRGQAKS